MTETHWSRGDRVLHTARPEWGVGQVMAADSVRQQGEDVQRLTIRFSRAGTKTISTAAARLRAVEPGEVIEAKPAAGESEVDQSVARSRLVSLPDAATDPFRSLSARIESTIGLYRFNASGGTLLDWAASQTGLTDPLSHFSRHELEDAFSRFRASLDDHLKKLVREARAKEPEALSGLGAKVSPEMKGLLTRMLTQR